MVQTSVEWLVEEFRDTILKEYGELRFLEILEQAKEMHKEETMDAFQAGKWDWSEHSNNNKHSKDPAEYYNETFKKD